MFAQKGGDEKGAVTCFLLHHHRNKSFSSYIIVQHTDWLQSHCWKAHICMRSLLYERGIALHSPWHVLCVSLRFLTFTAPPIISSMVVYARNELCSFNPKSHEIYRIWCHNRSHLVCNALGRREGRLLKLLFWSATAGCYWTTSNMHFMNWFIWIPQGNLLMFIYIGRHTLHDV